jgi:hypothetical protein
MLTLDQVIFICVLAGLCGMIFFAVKLVRRAHELMEGVRNPVAKDYIEAYAVSLNLDSDSTEPRGWHF